MTFLLILFLFTVYLLPTILSYTNHKKDKITIFLVNLLIGWTGFGWFIALYLSLRRDSFVIENR